MLIRKILGRLLVKLRLVEKPDFEARIVSQHPTPEEIQSERIIIVATPAAYKWACFKCPGGCNETILLSLTPNRHPCWGVEVDWLNRPTIYPSVKQLNQCRCHFWIKQGCVEWCND